MADEGFELEGHRMLYEYILSNPGVHLRRISRDLNISLSTLRYQIRFLEKKGILTGKKERNFKVFFAADRMGSEDRTLASLMQQKRFRDIVLTILNDSGATHSEISVLLRLKPPALSKYLRVLIDREIVIPVKEGRKKRFYLADEKRVLRVLLTYRKSFWDPFVDMALETYYEE